MRKFFLGGESTTKRKSKQDVGRVKNVDDRSDQNNDRRDQYDDRPVQDNGLLAMRDPLPAQQEGRLYIDPAPKRNQSMDKRHVEHQAPYPPDGFHPEGNTGRRKDRAPIYEPAPAHPRGSGQQAHSMSSDNIGTIANVGLHAQYAPYVAEVDGTALPIAAQYSRARPPLANGKYWSASEPFDQSQPQSAAQANDHVDIGRTRARSNSLPAGSQTSASYTQTAPFQPPPRSSTNDMTEALMFHQKDPAGQQVVQVQSPYYNPDDVGRDPRNGMGQWHAQSHDAGGGVPKEQSPSTAMIDEQPVQALKSSSAQVEAHSHLEDASGEEQGPNGSYQNDTRQPGANAPAPVVEQKDSSRIRDTLKKKTRKWPSLRQDLEPSLLPRQEEDLEQQAKDAMKRLGIKERSSATWVATALNFLPAALQAEREKIEQKTIQIHDLTKDLKDEKHRATYAKINWDEAKISHSKVFEERKFWENEARVNRKDLEIANGNFNYWYETAQQLQNNLAVVGGENATIKSDLVSLKAQREGDAQKLQELEDANKQLQQALEQRTGENAELHQKIESILAQAESERQQASRQLRDEQQRMQKEKDAAVQDIRIKMNDETKKLQGKIQSQSQRIAAYSRDTYAAVPDDTLIRSFRNVVQQINNLASCIPWPERFAFDGPALDPDDFLGRNALLGSRIWPKFIKNVCWRVLIKAFVQLPLGFGAVGPAGEGFQYLDALREYLTGGMASDKAANVARAFFFEAMAKDIGSRMQTSNGSRKRLTALFWDHVRATTSHLTAVLRDLGNGAAEPVQFTEQQVSGVVQGFGMLSLELGAQRAHLLIESCAHGQKLSATDGKFRDESDSVAPDARADLMTQPCLVRVGDGNEDLTSIKVLLKGVVVLLRNT